MTDDSTVTPATGGRAARVGLIRSTTERRIAGVCAALGRATGTDPLLWRVLLAVLTVFAGAGLVLYLVCWLLFPAQGDATSPLGSLVSARKSSTSRFVAVALVLAMLLVGAITIVSTDGRPFIVFGLIAAVVVLLARRNGDAATTPPVAPPVTVATPPPPPPPPPPSTEPYTAPFAPHGPYANRTLELPGETHDAAHSPPPPTVTVPVVEPVTPAPAPRPKRRSSLSLVTFSLVVIELGVAAILIMLGVAIPVGWALAAALLTCGGGLLVGTWWGRARALIPLGVVLSLILGAVTLLGAVPFTSQHVEPVAVERIPSRFTASLGDSRMDLTGVEFTDDDTVDVTVHVWLGQATIVVPENLDVHLDIDQTLGQINVDGESRSGDAPRTKEKSSWPGPDGEGGGTLTITGEVDTGQLEIVR